MGLSEENGLDRATWQQGFDAKSKQLLPVLKTNALMSGTCLLHYTGVQWFGDMGKGKRCFFIDALHTSAFYTLDCVLCTVHSSQCTYCAHRCTGAHIVHTDAHIVHTDAVK